MGPAHYAAACPDEAASLKMLQLLLTQGSNLPGFADASGSLCIHHVARAGNVLVMKYARPRTPHRTRRHFFSKPSSGCLSNPPPPPALPQILAHAGWLQRAAA